MSRAKVIGGRHARRGSNDAIRHVTRKRLNNRIEGDHAVPRHRLRPMRGLQGLSSATATLNRVETFRAIRRGDLHARDTGVLNAMRLVPNLFEDAEKAAWLQGSICHYARQANQCNGIKKIRVAGHQPHLSSYEASKHREEEDDVRGHFPPELSHYQLLEELLHVLLLLIVEGSRF